MRRRDLAMLIPITALAWPRRVTAQPAGRMRRIMVLYPQSEGDPGVKSAMELFSQSLAPFGWREGSTVHIEYRFAAGVPDRFDAYAAEIVAAAPDMIVAVTPLAVRALMQHTRTIPIVFTLVGDPVGYGFVESMARPGANVTGVANFGFAMGGKWVEVLKEIAPRVTRIAFIYNPAVAAKGYEFYLRSVRAAASSFAVAVTESPVGNDDDIDRVIKAFADEPNGGLLIPPDPFLGGHRERLIAAANHFSLPAVFTFAFFVTSGGLISYSVDPAEQSQQLASYVDRILRGAKPADLPVQGPTKFELAINLKTAKAIGLTVPQSLLLRADTVIE